MISLNNKKALVAGGCGLIGREIVKLFRKLEADVVVLDLNKSADIEMKLSAENMGLFRDILKDRKPDIWVNTTYPKNTYDHFESYLLSTQETAWYMARNTGGAMVLMSSIYGICGSDPRLYLGTDVQEPLIGYHAVKGAINGMMRAIATLYGSAGVRCNCVSPGGVYDGQDDKFVKRYIQHVPLRRMGLPEDVAGAVAFLVSDQSGYITGHNLLVGGGMTTYAWL